MEQKTLTDICPKCHNNVLIALFFDKTYQVKLECLLGHYNEIVDLDKFSEYSKKYMDILNQK